MVRPAFSQLGHGPFSLASFAIAPCVRACVVDAAKHLVPYGVKWCNRDTPLNQDVFVFVVRYESIAECGSRSTARQCDRPLQTTAVRTCSLS